MSSKVRDSSAELYSGLNVCALCHEKLHSRHPHPKGMSLALQSFLERISGVSELQCICKACEASARRCMRCEANEKTFVVQWGPSKEERHYCCIPSCTESVRVTSHSVSWNTICSCVGIAAIPPTSAVYPLCNTHYQLVYWHANTMVICTAKFAAWSDHTTQHRLQYDSCLALSQVLLNRETAHFEDTLAEDLLCYNCYKYFM